MSEKASVLSFKEVSKRYPCGAGSHHVLVDVSFALARGEVAAVIGDRFGGKTTLLRLAAGMEKPSCGDVHLNGRNLESISEHSRVSLLGNEVSWCDRLGPGMRLDVLDWVAMPLWVGRRRDRKNATKQAEKALAMLGVRNVSKRTWAELSMWERVQVPLARGIVSKPCLMLVDDLLDGLGVLRSQEASGLLRQIATESGCSILLTVSDEEVAILADRVLSLQGGELREFSRIAPSPPGKLVVFPRRVQAYSQDG